MLTGENGILSQAQKAKTETENAQAVEEDRLDEYEDYINGATGVVTGGEWSEEKGVNTPVLKGNMELVRYENGEWVEDKTGSNYSYVAGSGTADNNSSEWANARVTVDRVDSYFVWIPRYAYKITYNEDRTAGTIDVKFLVGTTDQYYDDNGILQTAKRATTGQEDTTSDYYVHPAFTNNVDLGGWRNELTGIWVGKYEAARLDATSENEGTDTKIKVQPGVISFRNDTIGNMYTYAREYDSNLNSHMLKNSEWGAVAYLTHSQYGRNGNEVTINNSSKYITGSAGNSVSAEEDVGTTNDYTSSQGVLASSTGNVYGIYDLSGGAYEYVSAYYISCDNLENGVPFAIKGVKSNEYTTTYNGVEMNLDYIIGDATYETKEWKKDAAYFLLTDYAFFTRGGRYNNEDIGGVFNFGDNNGRSSDAHSLRVCLTL